MNQFSTQPKQQNTTINQIKQSFLLSLLLLVSFLTSSKSIVQSLPNNNENNNMPFISSYSQEYQSSEEEESTKSTQQQYSLNYKAVSAILHLTCEVNQRLLYKRNCRVGHHTELLEDDDDTKNILFNNIVTPKCSTSTSELEEQNKEKSIFHSDEKLQSTKDISTFLQEIQSIFQLSNNHWSIPLAIYYLNLVTRISSNAIDIQSSTTTTSIPHLTYHTLKKLLLSCMILSKRVLHDYYQYDEYYHDLLPNLREILSKYNIARDELQAMEYIMLQTLASNFYETIEQQHFYYNNIHLRDILYVHPEMIQNMITSWEIALDNIPIFIHNQVKKKRIQHATNEEVEEFILLNRLSKQHHKSHLRNLHGHYDTPLLDRLFHQQEQRRFITNGDSDDSNNTTVTNSFYAHVQ